MKILKAMKPDVKIYLYGSNVPATFDFECENLNIIPIQQCNELYNKCKVGVCMSSSNPSRIPFEMMAAGLPVVELYKENNIYDLPDEGVLLAQPTPEAIATAIAHIIDNPEIAQKMSNFGKEYMKDFPLEKGFEQFLKAVKDMLETDYKDIPEIELLYKKEPFLASDEAIKCSEELIKIQPVNNVVDNHGKIYKFLRRVKRVLTNKLNY